MAFALEQNTVSQINLHADDCHVISDNDLQRLRIPGVLQRLAATYFVTAIIHFACSFMPTPYVKVDILKLMIPR